MDVDNSTVVCQADFDECSAAVAAIQREMLTADPGSTQDDTHMALTEDGMYPYLDTVLRRTKLSKQAREFIHSAWRINTQKQYLAKWVALEDDQGLDLVASPMDFINFLATVFLARKSMSCNQHD